jgi:hypothetical protein
MQFVNYRHRQRRTPADTNGRRVPGQERRKPGSTHRYLASDEQAAGSIRPRRRGFPPANLFSHRLPNLMVMSDFGRRMGATMSAQVRPDAVIVAAGRSLASPDIGFRSPVTGRPVCVVVIEVAAALFVRTVIRPMSKVLNPVIVKFAGRRHLGWPRTSCLWAGGRAGLCDSRDRTDARRRDLDGAHARQPAGPGTEYPRGRRRPGRFNSRTCQASNPQVLSRGEAGPLFKAAFSRCCEPALHVRRPAALTPAGRARRGLNAGTAIGPCAR